MIAAIDTAGRAVLFAGVTVIIALMGMLLLGVSFLYGVAVAAALAVLLTMIAALTAAAGAADALRRANRARRSPRRASAPPEAGTATHARPAFWFRWSGSSSGDPLAVAPRSRRSRSCSCCVAAPARAAPRLQRRRQRPGRTTTRKAYDLLAEGFGPGFNGPLAGGRHAPASGRKAALGRAVVDAQRANPASRRSRRRSCQPDGSTAVFQPTRRTSPQAAATTELLDHMRDDVLPPVESATGATVLRRRHHRDFDRLRRRRSAEKLPLFIGVVVLLSALLLMIVFRSLVIPLKARVDEPALHRRRLRADRRRLPVGLAGRPVRRRAPARSISFFPVLLFAIVFGLSMDYEVFLMSRIHEEWTHGRDGRRAVSDGPGPDRPRDHRRGGDHGLRLPLVHARRRPGDQAVRPQPRRAVFLDAFVVRSLLLPATLELLGRVTWMLPSWMERRLPHLAIEPPEPQVEAQEAG